MSAYWLSPTGKIIPVEISHIDYLIQNPQEFGLTRKIIEALYKKFKEPLGLEGKAREKLMFDALENGWLRIRETRNNRIIQGFGVESQAFRYLRNWADTLFLERKLYSEDVVVVQDLKTNKEAQYSVTDLMENTYSRVSRKIIPFCSRKLCKPVLKS